MKISDIEKLLENAEHEDMGRRNPQTDELDKAHYSDTRKPRLTLRMINQLKKMRINKQKEMKSKNKLVGKMYVPSEDEGI